MTRDWLLGVVGGVALLASGASAETVTLKVASFVPEQSFGVSKVIKPWIEAVKADAGDAVEFRTFWGGTLGKDPYKQYELVKNGVADVAWVMPGYTAGQFPELQIMELPFLVENAVEGSRAGWTLHEKGLVSGLDDVHLVGLWVTEPSILFTREPIGSLDDMERARVRSAGSVHAEWVTSLGAAPQTMSSTEMNEAFNRGTLDGAIQGWTGMATFKSLPLVEMAYPVPIGVIPHMLLMNKATWEGLPEKVRAAVTRHGGAAIADAGGAAYTEAGKALVEKSLEEGRLVVATIGEAQMAAYREAARPVHEWWIEKTPDGRTLYDAMVEALAEAREGS